MPESVGYLPWSWDVGSKGQFTARFPIEVPPGRAGMEPHLNVTYTGGTANGLLGVGFQLSGFSVVTRCSHTFSTEGWVDGVDNSDFVAEPEASRDRLCLDGTKLVALKGAYGEDGTEYRTENESYARIVSFGTSSLGPDGFTVETKGGLTRVYVPAEPPAWGMKRVRDQWLLDSETDRSGNGVKYHYTTISADPNQDSAVQYLAESIDYTTSDKGLPAHRKIVFEYEDRKGARDDPKAGMTLEEFGWLAGHEMGLMKRLKAITAYAPNPTLMAPVAPVWTYRLTYQAELSTHSRRSLLASLQKCVFDKYGKSDVCLWKKQFVWDTPNTPPYSDHMFEPYSIGPTGDALGTGAWSLVLDVDGDGRDEILAQYNSSNISGPDPALIASRASAGGPFQMLAYGTRMSVFNAINPTPFTNDTSLDKVLPIDTDGDGSSEVHIDGCPGQILHWEYAKGFQSTGVSFANECTGESEFADIDGDGLMDRIYAPKVESVNQLFQSEWAVFRNLGGNFSSIPINPTPLAPVSGEHMPHVVDFDGDGRAELYYGVASDEAIVAAQDDVGGFTTTVDSSALPGGKRYPATLNVLYVDLNGDGLQDAIEAELIYSQDLNQPPHWEYFLRWNTGRGYEPHQSVSIRPWLAQHPQARYEYRIRDMNNDGRADIVALVADPPLNEADSSFWSDIYVLYSNGDGTFQPVDVQQEPGMYLGKWKDGEYVGSSFSTTQMGDFNGDGRVDIVRSLPGPSRIEALIQQPADALNHQALNALDRLQSVWDEKDASPAASMTYSTDWSDKPETEKPCAYPVHCMTRGFPVVRSVTSRTSYSDANTPALESTTFYSYEGPKSDRRGRGSLGFRKTRAWTPSVPTETVTTYDPQNRVGDGYYPDAFRPIEVRTTVPLDTLNADQRHPRDNNSSRAMARVTQVNTNNELTLLNGGKTFDVRTTKWVSKEWEQPIRIDWKMQDGSNTTSEHLWNIQEPSPEQALRSREGFLGYDDFGNVKGAITSTVGGATTEVITSYDNLEADWLIGLQRTQTVTMIESDLSSVTRSSATDYDALGRPRFLYREKENPNADLRRTAELTYDAYGLVTQVTSTAGGGGQPDKVRTAHIEYGTNWPNQPDEHQFPVQIWQDFEQPESRPSEWLAIYPANGQPVARLDANGVLATMTYDAFGRPYTMKRDGELPVAYTYAGHPHGAHFDGLVATTMIGGQTAELITDADGRLRRSGSTGFDGSMEYTYRQYDALGFLKGQSRPTTGAPTLWTSYEHDPLGRTRKTRLPDLSEINSEPTFFSVTTTNAMQRQHQVVWDVNGRTVTSTEWLDNLPVTTKYAYEPFSALRQVTVSGLVTQTMLHDTLGRITEYQDADAGTVTMTYDGFDQMTQKTHLASAETTLFQYDSLGRPVAEKGPDGTTTYGWDQGPYAIGRLTSAKSPDGVISGYEYDSAGRAAAETQIADGKTLRLAAQYDAQGHLAQVDYPSIDGSGQPGMSLHYQYNPFNFLNQIDASSSNAAGLIPLIQILTRNSDGALTSAVRGGSLDEEWAYDPATGRPKHQEIRRGNTPLLDLTYAYYPDGSLNMRTDAVNARQETFQYDDLNRLTDVVLNQGVGPANTSHHTQYQYDPIGNLTHVLVDQQLTEQNDYGNPDGSLPHALTNHNGLAVGYDTHGRQVTVGGRTIQHYTAFDLPQDLIVNGVATTLAYDAFGERAKKTGLNKTRYLGQLYEQRDGKEHVFHVPGIAEITQQVGQAPSVHFTLTDTLGSVNVLAEANGVTQKQFFDAFGARTDITGQSPAAPLTLFHNGFTSQEHDDELGLINLHGRVYDPALKRMMSPDPHVTFPLAGQNYNRYSYVLNNPINFTDPTGFDECPIGNPYCNTKNEDAGAWDNSGSDESGGASPFGNGPAGAPGSGVPADSGGFPSGGLGFGAPGGAPGNFSGGSFGGTNPGAPLASTPGEFNADEVYNGGKSHPDPAMKIARNSEGYYLVRSAFNQYRSAVPNFIESEFSRTLVSLSHRTAEELGATALGEFRHMILSSDIEKSTPLRIMITAVHETMHSVQTHYDINQADVKKMGEGEYLEAVIKNEAIAEAMALLALGESTHDNPGQMRVKEFYDRNRLSDERYNAMSTSMGQAFVNYLQFMPIASRDARTLFIMAFAVGYYSVTHDGHPEKAIADWKAKHP